MKVEKMQNSATNTPAQSEIEQFQADGAIVLRGVFTDWVEPLKSGIEKIMADPSPLERSYQPEDGSAPFFQDFCNWPRVDEFHDFVFKSPAGAVAASLMNSSTSRFFHDHTLVKEPGSSIVTPWHQDQPYYCVEGWQTVSLWIPLDPVAKEISLQCVAGSHRQGTTYKPQRFDLTDLYEGDTRAVMPNIDDNLDDYRILSWEMEPGDAVAFDFRCIHGASANAGTNRRRRAFSARFVGDDAVYMDRKGKGSPPFRHLQLETGQALDGPDFPVVFQS